MGIKTDAFAPVDSDEQTAGVILKGVAASPGRSPRSPVSCTVRRILA